MAQASDLTPVLGLIKPVVGGDNNLWGEMLNTNSDTIDAAMGSVETELATKAVKVNPTFTGNMGLGTETPKTYAGYSSVSINGTVGGVIDLLQGDTRIATFNADDAFANIGHFGGYLTFSSGAGGAEQMRLDASGRLGIGTPNPTAKLEIGGTDSTTFFKNSGATTGYVFADIANTGCTLRYGVATAGGSFWSSGVAGGYSGNIGTVSASAFGIGTSDTLRITVSAGGYVGIGNSNPQKRLVVSENGGSGIELDGLTRSALNGSSILSYNRATSSYTPIEVDASEHSFMTQGTNRLKVDTVGNVTMGISEAAGVGYVKAQMSSGYGVQIVNHPSGAPNGSTFASWFYNGAAIGSVSQSSATSVAYNTSSDYRLKENVTPMAGSIDRLMRLKPSRFSWKAEPDNFVDGFLAHEAQEVVPEAITGTKDEVRMVTEEEAANNPSLRAGETVPVYQGIDQSKLVPLLTAALQDAINKINTLEQRIVQLENA